MLRAEHVAQVSGYFSFAWVYYPVEQIIYHLKKMNNNNSTQ